MAGACVEWGNTEKRISLFLFPAALTVEMNGAVALTSTHTHTRTLKKEEGKEKNITDSRWDPTEWETPAMSNGQDRSRLERCGGMTHTVRLRSSQTNGRYQRRRIGVATSPSKSSKKTRMVISLSLSLFNFPFFLFLFYSSIWDRYPSTHFSSTNRHPLQSEDVPSDATFFSFWKRKKHIVFFFF